MLVLKNGCWLVRRVTLRKEMGNLPFGEIQLSRVQWKKNHVSYSFSPTVNVEATNLSSSRERQFNTIITIKLKVVQIKTDVIVESN